MIFILARNILGTDYCMSVAKSILFRKPKELKVGTIAFLADRLYVGVFLLFFPVIFLLLLRKKKAENFIFLMIVIFIKWIMLAVQKYIFLLSIWFIRLCRHSFYGFCL